MKLKSIFGMFGIFFLFTAGVGIGFWFGYQVGSDAGYDLGVDDGYVKGIDDGYAKGVADGHGSGVADEKARWYSEIDKIRHQTAAHPSANEKVLIQRVARHGPPGGILTEVFTITNQTDFTIRSISIQLSASFKGRHGGIGSLYANNIGVGQKVQASVVFDRRFPVTDDYSPRVESVIMVGSDSDAYLKIPVETVPATADQ